MIEQKKSEKERLAFGFRLLTARQPTSEEMTLLRTALDGFEAKYQNDPEAAKKLIAVGESPVSDKVNSSEQAAYTMVASLMLNLDETLNKN